MNSWEEGEMAGWGVTWSGAGAPGSGQTWWGRAAGGHWRASGQVHWMLSSWSSGTSLCAGRSHLTVTRLDSFVQVQLWPVAKFLLSLKQQGDRRLPLGGDPRWSKSCHTQMLGSDCRAEVV